MAPTAYATRRGLPSHRRLDALLLNVHEIRRHAAVLALRAGEEHRGTRHQQALISRNRRQDRHVRADAVFRLAILELTCTTMPCGASVTVPTVALVITL